MRCVLYKMHSVLVMYTACVLYRWSLHAHTRTHIMPTYSMMYNTCRPMGIVHGTHSLYSCNTSSTHRVHTHTHTHTHTHEQYTQCIENTTHTHTYRIMQTHQHSREAMGRYISFSYGEIKYRTRERDEKKMKRKRRMKEGKE